MPTRTEIVQWARECLDTPYHHQGRVVGIRGGMDCFGPILHVANRCRLVYTDIPNYPRKPATPDALSAVIRNVEGVLELGEEASPLPGRVGIFWMDPRQRWEQHVGLFTPTGLLHCWSEIGKVVEHPLTPKWTKRLLNVFEYPGIKDFR